MKCVFINKKRMGLWVGVALMRFFFICLTLFFYEMICLINHDYWFFIINTILPSFEFSLISYFHVVVGAVTCALFRLFL
jgi:hypothetical protein